MNGISPKNRYSEDDGNISANTNLSHSQVHADTIKPNLDERTEPTHLKSEDEEPCNKCGRSEIPTQIEYMPQGIADGPKKQHKDSNSPEGITEKMDCLKTRIDYSEIRLDIIEKTLFSSQKSNQ